jgi:hypothetical protein
MEQLGSHCTDFHDIRYLRNLRKKSRFIKIMRGTVHENTRGTVHENMRGTMHENMRGTVHGNLYTYVIPRCIILGIRSASNKSCRENQNIYSSLSIAHQQMH